MRPLGYIKSCFKEKFGTPRQPHVVPLSSASIKILGEWNPKDSLSGLEEFSHVWIIFEFHQNENKNFNAKIYPPRLNGQSIGVFATRSPHRPNPIGLTCAKLERIEGDTLYVSGVDFIEGTPVLDIKPYIAAADSKPEASEGWIKRAPDLTLKVEFSEQAREDLQKFDDKNLQAMITQILANDPRNPMDREPSRSGKVLGFFLDNYNVVFKVHHRTALVINIQTREEYDRYTQPS